MLCILYSVAATSFDDSHSAVVQTIYIIQLIDTSNFYTALGFVNILSSSQCSFRISAR